MDVMNEAQLRQRVAELQSLLEKKDAKIAYLQEPFLLAQQKQFGRSSEGQGGLFDEVEEIIAELGEPEQEIISRTRSKTLRDRSRKQPI
jgi:transposase